MLSKYFVFSGIILAVMLLLDVLLFRPVATGIRFGAVAFLAIMFLAFPIYHSRVRSWIAKTSKVFLLLFSVVTNLIFVAFVVIILANLPKGKPFEEKVVFSPPPEDEVQTYREFTSKSSYKWTPSCLTPPDNWDKKPFDYTHPDMVRLLSSECEAERARLLDFHLQNVISKPLVRYKGEHIDDLDIPDFIHLHHMYKIELADIARHLNAGDLSSAQQKYIRLWKGTENLLSSQLAMLIQTINAISQVGLLTEFYGQYADKLQLERNEQLVDIVKNVILLMDKSMSDSMTREYAFMKGVFLKFASEEKGPNSFRNTFQFSGNRSIDYLMMTVIGDLPVRWPFFDLYKTLKLFDDWYYEISELSEKPGYKTQVAWQEIDSKGHEHAKSSITSLENWAGRISFSLALPNLRSYVQRKEVKKSQAIAMVYLLTLSDPNNFDQIPVDNLTGKKFQVTAENDTLEIQGKEVHYKVKRTSP